MPTPLPGLRWDDVKQRYFPLAYRPPSTPAPAAPASPPARRLSSPYHALSDLRAVCRTAHKDALVHRIRSSQISLTDEPKRSVVPLHGLISAFQTASHNGQVWSFVGDTVGGLVVGQESDTVDRWQHGFTFFSEISSIATSSTACVATSFGPDCAILFLPLHSPIDGPGIHLLRVDARILHDIWTTDLYGSRLVLGANKQAVMIEDIDLGTSLHRLPTQSDVFALAQRENILYTGLRNGNIIRFDTRVQSSKHHLFDGLSRRKSPITGLKLLRDYQLLASFLDGGISAFDLRFPIRTPLMNFTGNSNSYTTRLPLVTDPHENFLFAAGQDNRIRVWSLTTGGPALGTGATAFQRPFEHRLAALQVVEEREGMYLWAASGTELCKYSLGRRAEIGT